MKPHLFFMKQYKILLYMGILLIVGSIIGFLITNNIELKLCCCMFMFLGVCSLINAIINKYID